MRNEMGNNVALFFPRFDKDCATVSKESGINEAASQGLGREQCKAFPVFIKRNPYNKSREKEVSSENSMLEC